MATHWIINEPEYQIGIETHADRFWMHCNIEKYSVALSKHIRKDWNDLLMALKKKGVDRVFAHLYDTTPSHSHKLAKLGGMTRIGESDGHIYYVKEI